MSRLSDMSVIRDWEKRWLNPDDDDDFDDDDEELWNRADDDAEEEWLARLH